MAAIFENKRQIFSAAKSKKVFTALDIPSEPNSPPSTPLACRKSNPKSPLFTDPPHSHALDPNKPSTSSPRANRFFLLRKKTKSEPSLLEWIFKPASSCCRVQSPRPSDAEITLNSHVSVSHVSHHGHVGQGDCFTLTPLYIDEQRESFEVRRSAPRGISPLPWATSLEPNYPNWIRSELRSELRQSMKNRTPKGKTPKG
ncbi:hypothetical protein BV898_10466 [Hypsibius exemplaris]|uniref:Uncharacterized protein n=1 Tax=Hypsibius exemplaris TaxID=2072580 RepID=A0A1W0WJF9_HYPEX|nr:hypothetical protein BV898_10466 [Hypsibius exemplaris]